MAPTEPARPEPKCSLEGQGRPRQKELRPKRVLGGMLFSFLSGAASSVLIAGDFNRWIAEPLLLVDGPSGLWQKIIPLSDGTYHYKYLVNDLWQIDPYNRRTKMNRYGGTDSVITVNGAPVRQGDGQKAEAGPG